MNKPGIDCAIAKERCAGDRPAFPWVGKRHLYLDIGVEDVFSGPLVNPSDGLALGSSNVRFYWLAVTRATRPLGPSSRFLPVVTSWG